MAGLSLNVDMREGRGKGYANRLYAKGYMPAVVYGKGIGSIPVELSVRDLEAILKTKAGRNSIIDMQIQGPEEQKQKVMIKDVEYHPIKRDILHADFVQISMTDKIQITVPLQLVGDAPGTAEGGRLEHLLWEVDIKCLPGGIPDNLTVDVSGLNIGDSINVVDINVPEGVEIMAEEDTVVARVAAPAAVETEEGEEGEAAEESETAEAGAAGENA